MKDTTVLMTVYMSCQEMYSDTFFFVKKNGTHTHTCLINMHRSKNMAAWEGTSNGQKRNMFSLFHVDLQNERVAMHSRNRNIFATNLFELMFFVSPKFSPAVRSRERAETRPKKEMLQYHARVWDLKCQVIMKLFFQKNN